MKVKETWINSDYEEMGWHDSRIYAFHLPLDDFKFVLEIDYLFEWVKQEDESFKFWVSPCSLIFLDTLNIKFDIDFENHVDLYIDDILRGNERLSPNGRTTIWDFIIHTDKGVMSFVSSGIEQKVHKQPILSDSQTLARLR